MGGDSKVKNSIRKALPDNLKSKYYNASALIMSDYSGKQKIIAKMSKAKLVVIVKQQTMEILESPQFDNYIIIDGDDPASIEQLKAKL